MKIGNIVKWSIVVVLLCFGSCSKDGNDARLYIALKDVHRLTLAEMSINKMGTIDDMTWDNAEGVSEHIGAFINKFKAGKRIGVYSYNTYLQAYIDLDELTEDDVKVDKKGSRVTLVLPPVKVAYVGRDMGIKEEHLRVTGLRSAITPQERAKVKEVMNEALKKEIGNSPELSKSLVEDAKFKARQYFSILLENLGYDSDITFKE